VQAGSGGKREEPTENEMATARKAQPKSVAGHRRAEGFAGDLADLVRILKALLDPYRPELHYMRGPGPKWHAKHDPASVPSHAAPALARLSTQ
jgi:hypothetical protein